MSAPSILHVPDDGFFIDERNQRIAELTYRRVGPDRVIADHTWVSDELRGRGIARQLLDALAAWARQSGTKIVPQCSYIAREVERDASLRDIVA
jgi:uncharacterized protein